MDTNLLNIDTMLCHYIQLKARPQPSRNVMQNVRTWLSNRNEPINTQELSFINARDLITAAKFEKSKIRRLFEQFILAPTSGLFGLLLRTPPGDEAYAESTTVMGEDEHVDAIAAAAIFIVALTMLIAPLWTLAVLEDIFRKLAVITAFTLVLLLVLTWGTLARPLEILAAAAG